MDNNNTQERIEKIDAVLKQERKEIKSAERDLEQFSAMETQYRGFAQSAESDKAQCEHNLQKLRDELAECEQSALSPGDVAFLEELFPDAGSFSKTEVLRENRKQELQAIIQDVENEMKKYEQESTERQRSADNYKNHLIPNKRTAIESIQESIDNLERRKGELSSV